MRNGKRFTGKLAVAAVAVAGVVGMAWAQLPVGGDSFGTGSMSATFTVQQIAEMEVTPNNPTEENLVLAVAAEPKVTDIVGNLGTIRVKTNSAGWDVLMTTDRGGRMLDKTSVGCVEVPDVDGWGNPTGKFHDSCSTAGAKYLTWNNSGTKEAVVLDVALGVAKQGAAIGNTGAPTKLFPLLNALTAGVPSFAAPVKVSVPDVTGSDKSAATTTVVSFATVIGGGYDGTGTGTAPTGAFNQGIYGTTTATTEGTWAGILANGFPKPGAVEATNVLPNVDKEEEYLYVNVGMPQTTFNALEGNNGTFTETFHFELVANF
jgi:hypothetical protein